MIIKRFEVGPILVNSYIVGCEKTGAGAIVDPGDEGDMLVDEAKKLGLRIDQIINTHGHLDHIAANREVKELTGAKIYIHRLDADMLTDAEKNMSLFLYEPIISPAADEYLEEGRIHKIGSIEFKILHVPGHSAGSVCLAAEDVVIVGDTLFAGSVGRSDFPGCSHELLIKGIKEKLMTLGDHFKVLPGHSEATTIGYERKTNPFLR